MAKGIERVFKWLAGQAGDNGTKTPQTANTGESGAVVHDAVVVQHDRPLTKAERDLVEAHLLNRGGSGPLVIEIAKSGSVIKADDERQVLYVPALVPDTEDSQGDVVSADDIMAAAHGFMADYPLYKEATGEVRMMGIGLDHADKNALPRERAYLVETWLEKTDTQYGDELVPAGTWMIGVHVPDAEIWESAKSGERTGVSIEGIGTREPL
jgi:hypothetical protein